MRHNLINRARRTSRPFNGRRTRRLIGGLAAVWIIGFGTLKLDQWVANHFNCPLAPHCSYLLVCFLMPIIVLGMFFAPFRRDGGARTRPSPGRQNLLRAPYTSHAE